MAGMRRSEVSALRWADVVDTTRRRRRAGHRPKQQDEPGGRDERRAVRKGRCRARHPHAPGCHEPGADRSRGPVVGADDRVEVHGRGAGRRCRVPGNRALRSGRSAVGTDEPWRVDHRRDVSRELEDQPDGGALFRWGDRGTRCRGALPVGRPNRRVQDRARRAGVRAPDTATILSWK